MKQLGDARELSVSIVWVPQSGAEEIDVPQASKGFDDLRGRHYWDEGSLLTDAFTALLKSPKAAWDTYFIYDAGVRWEASQPPPMPSFFMHQLGPKVPGPRLDSVVFAREIARRLGR